MFTIEQVVLSPCLAHSQDTIRLVAFIVELAKHFCVGQA